MDANSLTIRQGREKYSLYLVTDRGLAAGKPLVEIVEAALAGGVSCVQLREKTLDTREFVREARALKELLASKSVPLIINDRIDIALVVGADGIHLGQSDMDIGDARRITGGNMIIGISAESVQDGITAEKQGADYIGVSPVFTTPTKSDIAPPLGLAGLSELRSRVRIPLVAIGGINRDNCRDVIRAGADGIAVVSAIVAADSPKKAAADLYKQIHKAKTQFR